MLDEDDDEDALTFLTEAQERVLDYIEDRINDGQPPTYREITEHFGWASTFNAQEHVLMLEKKGRIKRIPGVNRGIKLVAP